MIYGYRCPSCAYEFDVVKSASQFDRLETCDKCRSIAERQFVPNRNAIIKSSGLSESPEYNPGLGCVVKSKQHRREICRARGLEEIGNETPETIHKHYDKVREDRINNAYEEATKGWVGDGSS